MTFSSLELAVVSATTVVSPVCAEDPTHALPGHQSLPVDSIAVDLACPGRVRGQRGQLDRGVDALFPGRVAKVQDAGRARLPEPSVAGAG